MSKKMVLVVEDHKDQNDALCRIVEQAGYEAISAFNGIDAFRKLKYHRRGLGFLTNDISCILLDWQMPKMRGEEFLKILRRNEQWKTFAIHIPVVIISVYDSPEKRKAATNSNFGLTAEYITKPYNAEEVIDVLHRIIRDQDNATLVEMNRKNTFYVPREYEQIYQAQVQHAEDIKIAFCDGEVNDLSVEFLDNQRLDFEILYEECKQRAKLDSDTMVSLETIKNLLNSTYVRLANANTSQKRASSSH